MTTRATTEFRPGSGSTARVAGGIGGFTLIEVMVSLALMSVVMAGAFASIMVLGRTQASTARIDVAQSGARAALEILTRDVQMVSAGARTGSIAQTVGSSASVLSLRVIDSASAPDRLELLLVDPSVSAAITAAYSGGTTLSVSSTTGFKAGDVIQLSDLATAVQLSVSAVPGTTTITVQSPAWPLPQTYAAGAYVFRSRVVSYYVASPFGAQDPMLMLDPDGPGPQAAQPMAEGIEDFQVALGIDLNGDGLVSSVGVVAGDDEWIHNVSGETAPATLAGLESLRVTLVARPSSALGGLLGTRPTAENRAGSAIADAFPRRVLRSEIAVRNFNL